MTTINAITNTASQAARALVSSRGRNVAASGLMSYAMGTEAFAKAANAASPDLLGKTLSGFLQPAFESINSFLGVTRLGTAFTLGGIGSVAFGVTALEHLIGAFTKSGSGPIGSAFKAVANFATNKGQNIARAAKTSFQAAA